MISFRVDQRSGALSRLEIYEVGSLPMWVLIADLAN
jgi:6-phosphogluconolactonase (cycloisomerase 2 family)